MVIIRFWIMISVDSVTMVTQKQKGVDVVVILWAKVLKYSVNVALLEHNTNLDLFFSGALLLVLQVAKIKGELTVKSVMLMHALTAA